MNTKLCGIQLDKDYALQLVRSIYDCLIVSPIREQDLSTINELRQYLIENGAMKGSI